jgi:hypothetical protein
MTDPDDTYLEDERIAIQQESSGKKIDEVRRNVATGELLGPLKIEPKSTKRSAG